MNIAIVLPRGADQRSGNRHTAQRWARLLRDLGHRVTVSYEWTGGEADVLIALHARKSYGSIARFHRLRPDAPLVVVLTGTDLYRDIRTSVRAQQALEFADRLVVLQYCGRAELPRAHRAKTRVVYQSADVAIKHAPHAKSFRVVVVGHLRREKEPFCAARALSHLPSQVAIEVIQLGAALKPEMASSARRWMHHDARYRWLGSKTHAQTMRAMAASRLLVVSSIMEGGANVVCEAARIGLPVLASHVPGNIGMLGACYPGYYALRDDAALARLMLRARNDAAFYRKLKRAINSRRDLFAPSAERNSLKRLLRELQ